MKILVVGGTGGFGSKICTLLSQDGHDVTAASRSIPDKPIDDIAYIQINRSDITADHLAHYDIVVDAAGPFQGLDSLLLDAAIDAGVHHIDISDDIGFIQLAMSKNEAAENAKICVISGASSIPGLSSAVAFELAKGLDAVETVDIAISASAKAVFGRSVLMAMLTNAGLPLPGYKSRTPRSMTTPKWVMIKSPMGDLKRKVLLCPSPDAMLLPEVLPGKPIVHFRAGSELILHNLSMQAIASTVRLRVVKSGLAFAKLAGLAQRLTANLGSGRSGMIVELVGIKDGSHIKRQWSLVAENGSGPTIPCLLVPAIVQAIANGTIKPGAQPCLGLENSPTILSRFPNRDYNVTTSETIVQSIYERATGSNWHAYHPVIRSMHSRLTKGSSCGIADITRGKSIAAKILCSIIGFPKNGKNVFVRVEFDIKHDHEVWTRTFGEKSFSSRLYYRPRGVEDQFGPLRFRFLLKESAGNLQMVPDGWSLWRIPLPSILAPTGTAVEDVSEDGSFRFDVPIRAPIIGEIVHYRGTLKS